MANVPKVPGVPALPSFSASIPVLLIADAIASILSLFAEVEWGIFLEGNPAMDFNSVQKFEYKQDWPISDYPVQEGAFQSYDKVQLPFDNRLTLTSGSSAAERQQFLADLKIIGNSLKLYDVVTPEAVYASTNVSHIDYRRTATNGVGMIIADLWLVEIRVSATAKFSNTKSPNSAGQQGLGVQQAQTPPASVTQNFGSSKWEVQ